MKTKTKSWLEMAESDLEFAQSVLRHGERPYYAVHFCHQALEKLLKAIIQEHTDQIPKRTHNFKVLWEQGNIPLTDEQKLTLLEIMPHYIGSRYPEDVRMLHRTYTLDFVKEILKKTEVLFLWLKNFLMSPKLSNNT